MAAAAAAVAAAATIVVLPLLPSKGGAVTSPSKSGAGGAGELVDDHSAVDAVDGAGGTAMHASSSPAPHTSPSTAAAAEVDTVVGGGSDAGAPAVVRCARVRCVAAYNAFKREHGVKEGAFYIVHNGKVLNEPLSSREQARRLLQAIEREGRTVNWAALMVIEAGNEWGKKALTHARVHRG